MREKDRETATDKGVVKTRGVRIGRGGGRGVEGCDYGVTASAALS